MSGGTRLTDEQRAFYLKRFGREYLAVQENPYRPSRRVRRGRLRDEQDFAVYEAQMDVQRSLDKLNMRPA